MQLSYNIEMNKAVAGLDGTGPGQNKTVLTKTNTIEIPFGRVVAKGTGDHEVKLPTSGSDVLIGGVLRDTTIEQGAATEENAYPVKSDVAVMTEGIIWLELDGTVTTASPVYIRHTVNTGKTKLGVARADADTDKAILLTNAVFLGGGASGDYAPVLINKP